MSLSEDATRQARPLFLGVPPTIKKVVMPESHFLDAAFLHYADYSTLIQKYVGRQHRLYRLAEELTLLAVAARFPWVMRMAWDRGYRGPWQMVENIYRMEKDL